MAKAESDNVVMMEMFPEDTPLEKFLTVEDLSFAILHTIGADNISKESAFDMAQHMMNFFGFQDEIIDNILEPPDRDIFYTMEDYSLMSTEREETTLWDGREWRINYWKFRKDRIMKILKNPPVKTKKEEVNEFEDIYDNIPEDIWTSRY